MSNSYKCNRNINNNNKIQFRIVNFNTSYRQFLCIFASNRSFIFPSIKFNKNQLLFINYNIKKQYIQLSSQQEIAVIMIRVINIISRVLNSKVTYSQHHSLAYILNYKHYKIVMHDIVQILEHMCKQYTNKVNK